MVATHHGGLRVALFAVAFSLVSIDHAAYRLLRGGRRRRPEADQSPSRSISATLPQRDNCGHRTRPRWRPILTTPAYFECETVGDWRKATTGSSLAKRTTADIDAPPRPSHSNGDWIGTRCIPRSDALAANRRTAAIENR
jgi:hypothetical protein